MTKEERIEALEQEVKRLLWIINNPPKYKVGDKIGVNKITKVEIEAICRDVYKYDWLLNFKIIKVPLLYKYKYIIS